MFSDLLDACDAVGELARGLGVGLLDAEDDALDGRTVRIGGESKLHFNSCSTLGLELDSRLIEGAIDATRRFGTQFSVSRAFMSAPPYAELEARLGEICGGAAIVTPNTTLASASALPSLVGEKDVVLLDHQVHMTVQMALPLLQRMGVAVEFVRHGRLDELEERIRTLRASHRRIWFLLDGVYSMHGDLAPMRSIAGLLERYEQLHVYVDDAHGMSWTGKHGRGHALEQLPDRERVVVAVSLNKSFGAGGAALVLPDEATRRRVRHTGGPLLFSGPLQPPMLGACLASARIHLSSEIERLQAELRARILHTNRRARELGLPLLHGDELVPIRFIGLGPAPAATALAARLVERGILVSCALFPAVPSHQTGIRFSVTRHHSLEDIDRLLDETARLLPEALAQGGTTRAKVDRAFGLTPVPEPRTGSEDPVPARRAALCCEHHDTIAAIDADEWDGLLGERGSFDAGGLRYLEKTFGHHQSPESRWRFHYLHVRDGSGRAVAASFFTESWMKDDLFADPAVSRAAEQRRRTDPSFLTSRVLSMGSPLTEGNHLHLDRTGPWRDALRLLIAGASELAEESGVEGLALRDLPADDPELDALLTEHGFLRLRAPDSMRLEVDWKDRDEYRARLSRRARRFQRREVEPHADDYRVEIVAAGDLARRDGLASHLHGLYRNVWERSLDLNTFALPGDFLPCMLEHPGFEIVTLTRREPGDLRCGRLPDAFFAARIGRDHYVPFVVGLDFRGAPQRRAYRRCLAEAIARAQRLGKRRVLLGLGAALEKQRFGAQPIARNVWLRTRDPFNAAALALLAGEVYSGRPR